MKESQLQKLTQAIEKLISKEVAPIAVIAPVAPVLPVAPIVNQNSGDHDALNTLIGSVADFKSTVNEKFADIKADIKALNDNAANRIAKLEVDKLDSSQSYPALYKKVVEERLDKAEIKTEKNTNDITKIMTWGTAGGLALVIAEFLLNKFWK